jgi:hypothetical protein
MKALRRASITFARRRVDHVVVIGGDLPVQALGCMRQEVAVLVDRAALHRYAVPHGGNRAIEPGCAVDDEELGPPQARERASTSSSSASNIACGNSRVRSRRPASIGSNQLSKSRSVVSISDCGREGVVIVFVMA